MEDNNQYNDTYRTGDTKPPKSRRGAIALLLVLVILLGGIVSILGLVNIRLLQEVGKLPEETVPIAFSVDQTEPPVENTATQAPVNEDPVCIEDNSPSTSSALPLQEIYEKAIPSVVSIICSLPNGSSTGTGVVLTEDGYIVTNCHVVKDAVSVSVLLTDGRNMEARVVGLDAISDLAVLSISADKLVAAQLGDSANLRVGDSVVAIGDPLGVALRGTMTNGIISAINRDIVVDGRTMNLIQTNAALNSGNSGGPLLNDQGQVIGINTIKMGDSMSASGVEGLGFAIPSATVRDIVNQLIRQGYVSGRPDLGFTGETISPLYHFYYGLPEGLLITQVEEDSAAYAAGIRPNDILLSIGGQRIVDNENLTSVLYGLTPGETVQILVYRVNRQFSGQQLVFTITIDEANG